MAGDGGKKEVGEGGGGGRRGEREKDPILSNLTT